MIHKSNKELLILGIDTSCSQGAVGLIQGEQVLGEIPITGKGTFSKVLLPSIHRLFDESGERPENIDLLAVIRGPGSFTGIRIGLATVKGLAYTLDVAVAGVVSLEAIAWGCGVENHPLSICLPARPGWVYSAKYVKEKYDLQCLIEPNLESLEDWLGQVGERDLLLGEGVLKYRSEIEEIYPDVHISADIGQHYSKGANVARLGHRQYLQNQGQTPDRLSPFYLQSSIAEQRWEKRQIQSQSMGGTDKQP